MSFTYGKPEYIGLENFLTLKKITQVEFEEIIQSNYSADLVGGSLVNGHGTTTSDIDLFRFDNTLGKFTILNDIQKSIRFDLEVVAKDEFNKNIQLMKDIDLNTDEGVEKAGFLSIRQLEQIARVSMSTGLTEIGDKLKKSAQESPVGQFMSLRFWMMSENNYEDAIGFYKIKDYFNCNLSINESLLFGLMAKLNALELLCDRKKWVSFYLSRYDQKKADKFMRMMNSVPVGGVDLKSKISAVNKVIINARNSNLEFGI